MPLDSSLVGTTVGPVEAEVDARWTMAYAASLGDLAPCYLDTRRPEGIIAHPLFPVCFEWPAAGAIRAKLRGTMAPGEPARGVHATHHTVIHRNTVIHRTIRPPVHLRTTAEVIGIERRSAGAYDTVRFATADDAGTPMCTTYYGSLYRQVEVIGADRPAPITPLAPLDAMPAKPRLEVPLHIAAGARIPTRNARASGIQSIPTRRSQPTPACRD
jgi:hypothetical protein